MLYELYLNLKNVKKKKWMKQISSPPGLNRQIAHNT